jgi:outer membrane protein insertion porin family
MNKQVNMKNTFVLALVALVLPIVGLAQVRDTLLPVIPYDQPKEYEIAGIRVVGSQYADANALISVSGLKVGDKIRMPGQVFTKAVQSLWNLRLFTDVQIIRERTQGDLVFLEIQVKELPRYMRHTFTGVKKNQHDDLNGVINKYIQKGSILTENARSTLVYAMEEHYVDKGYRNAKVKINTYPDERSTNGVRLEFVVDRGKRVKIRDITFAGNQSVKTRVLRKKMKNTTRISRIFKKSKLVRSKYDEDKLALETYYNNVGFRDARVVKDSIWRDGRGRLRLHLTIEEGRRYYFRDIVWKGNTIYETKYLDQVLGIKKGDVYNEELLNNRLSFSQDGRDISSLYLDNGYLFFRADPVEVAIENDSIDLEMRVYEGPQATIDRVVIKGNDRTHEHVIRRELYTRPGDKFSRSDIIRSQREIINLGYFNQEALGINTPVNPERGTVDIEYTVEERPSDQLELSAGYQPRSFFNERGSIIGTLGVTFNNFSLRNIPNREQWNPLPQGDGQRFSIRGQSAGERFQSYNASFTEPWLGGKRPNSLTLAGFYNRFSTGFTGSNDERRLDILQGTIGFGTRLKWPDDNFVFRADVDIQTLKINRYGGFVDDLRRQVDQGIFHNYNLGLTLARNSVNDPIFPKGGSTISLKMQMTPPYSLFQNRGAAYYDTASVRDLYRYVEYLKWRVDAEWYTPVVGKLVLKTSTKIGLLGRWNRRTLLSPFERFQVGGDGLNNQNFGLNGQEIISSRGYEAQSESGAQNGIMDGLPGGAGVFSKYTAELRYPISLSPQSTIFVTAWAQGTNAWANIRQYNPFDVRRSAGLGLRVFLPMFGTLGFDYGFGFDRPDLVGRRAKLTDYGNFNIILGFEPD